MAPVGKRLRVLAEWCSAVADTSADVTWTPSTANDRSRSSEPALADGTVAVEAVAAQTAEETHSGVLACQPAVGQDTDGAAAGQGGKDIAASDLFRPACRSAMVSAGLDSSHWDHLDRLVGRTAIVADWDILPADGEAVDAAAAVEEPAPAALARADRTASPSSAFAPEAASY